MISRSLIARCLAGLALTILPACSPPSAASRLATQNLDNSRILIANALTLADLIAAQSAALSDIRLIEARQQTAIALARTLNVDPAALELRRDALHAHLAAAPLAQRESIITALAHREPALLDLAVSSPGFTLDRILRDAAGIDALHIELERETNAALRASILARRDAILEPYALIRFAAESSATDAAALTDFRAALTEQSQILMLHAQALASFTAEAPLTTPTASSLYRSQQLRELLLDSIERSRGRETRNRIADWLNRTDTAIDIVLTN